VNQIKKIHSNTVNIGQGWACGYYSLNEAATPITLPVLGGVTKKKIMHQPIMYQIKQDVDIEYIFVTKQYHFYLHKYICICVII
jgi:hypothetical protein